MIVTINKVVTPITYEPANANIPRPPTAINIAKGALVIGSSSPGNCCFAVSLLAEKVAIGTALKLRIT